MKGSSQPAFEIARARSQQDVVGVPVQAQDSRANGLLNVLTNPPGKQIEQDSGCSECTAKLFLLLREIETLH